MDVASLMQSLSIEDRPQFKSNFKVGAVNVSGHNTELVFGEFVNKFMVIATQFEKLGSLLRVTVDQQVNGVNILEPVYTVSVVFGAENIEQQAAARFIAGSLQIKKPLLIFLCLKDYSAEVVRGIAVAILDLIKD